MSRLRNLHLTLGAAGFVAFLLTGQYMQWVHEALVGMPDGPRLFFRSAHIYLLWSSLLNLMLACYLNRLTSGVARYMQVLGSVCILAGPVLLCGSFFLEQYNADLLRPVGHSAIFLAVGGVFAHMGALFMVRRGAGSSLAGAVEDREAAQE